MSVCQIFSRALSAEIPRCQVPGVMVVVVLDVREAVVRTRRRSSLSRRSTDLEMIKKVRVVTGHWTGL